MVSHAPDVCNGKAKKGKKLSATALLGEPDHLNWPQTGPMPYFANQLLRCTNAITRSAERVIVLPADRKAKAPDIHLDVEAPSLTTASCSPLLISAQRAH